jgi:hypothetical protein
VVAYSFLPSRMGFSLNDGQSVVAINCIGGFGDGVGRIGDMVVIFWSGEVGSSGLFFLF